MRAHHTKNKGDLGVRCAQVDLARRGYAVLLPLTEHAPFDLVTYKDGRFFRVQVKYRAAKDGFVAVQMGNVWADRHGVHLVPIARSSIDLICVYCPDTDRCYHVDPHTCLSWIRLRTAPPRNNQKKGIQWAKDYEEIPASVLGVSAGCDRALEGAPHVRHSASHRAQLRYAPIAQVDQSTRLLSELPQVRVLLGAPFIKPRCDGDDRGHIRAVPSV